MKIKRFACFELLFVLLTHVCDLRCAFASYPIIAATTYSAKFDMICCENDMLRLTLSAMIDSAAFQRKISNSCFSIVYASDELHLSMNNRKESFSTAFEAVA